MGIFSNAYNNFFTVCTLIPTVFMFSMAMVFLSLREKSKATLHLGLAFFYLTFFFGAYFFCNIIYNPIGAYHRWITVGVVLPVSIHMAQFAFYFPNDRKPKLRKAFFYIQYLFSFTVTAVFIMKTIHAPRIYQFTGHNWDFSADEISKIIGLIIILFLLIFTFIGIWKTIVTKTKERWAMLFIDIALTVGVMIPAVANTLSRDGAMDRGTYMITQVLATILGFFFAGIIYINATTDRTNFMTKILGISLATILIVFQNLSWFSLLDLDNSYDALRKKDLTITLDSNKIMPNLDYLVEYAIDKDEFKLQKSNNQSISGINFDILKTEFKNTALYEEIKMIPAKDFNIQLKDLLKKSHPYFAGYKNTIFEIAEKGKLSELSPAEDVLSGVTHMRRKILFTSNKVKALPDANFRSHLEKFFAKSDPKLKGFKDAIFDYSSGSALKDAGLKKEVLQFLTPFNQGGTRNYRKSETGEHFTSYMYSDLKKKIIHEAGFSYLSYRQYIHPTSTKFIYLLSAILVVIFIGFQFFFLGAFVRPLKSLLKGMYQVSEGNLKINIPVAVEDELGYITHNFNRMVDNLRISNEKLADYAQNLENKVKERTSELNQSNVKLKKAMDALWGEMELAKKIQTALLPKNPKITGYDIAAHMSPADEVGGDYYDVINVQNMDWIVIGDVSGHGVPAGLIMMMVQTAIQVVLVQHSDMKPSELLAVINKTITQNIKKLGEDKYMTITVISCITGGKFYFTGLHQDIMIHRKKSGKVELQETKGMWIGVMEDINGMIEDESFVMNVGDSMILFSDGITEATQENANGTIGEFGTDRLVKAFEDSAKGTSEQIKNAIFEDLKSFTTHDDITIVVLKRLG